MSNENSMLQKCIQKILLQMSLKCARVRMLGKHKNVARKDAQQLQNSGSLTRRRSDAKLE